VSLLVKGITKLSELRVEVFSDDVDYDYMLEAM